MVQRRRSAPRWVSRPAARPCPLLFLLSVRPGGCRPRSPILLLALPPRSPILLSACLSLLQTLLSALPAARRPLLPRLFYPLPRPGPRAFPALRRQLHRPTPPNPREGEECHPYFQHYFLQPYDRQPAPTPTRRCS